MNSPQISPVSPFRTIREVFLFAFLLAALSSGNALAGPSEDEALVKARANMAATIAKNKGNMGAPAVQKAVKEVQKAANKANRAANVEFGNNLKAERESIAARENALIQKNPDKNRNRAKNPSGPGTQAPKAGKADLPPPPPPESGKAVVDPKEVPKELNFSGKKKKSPR